MSHTNWSDRVDWINAGGAQILGVKHFRVLQLLISIGLILSIAGGTSGSPSSNGTVKPSTTSQVGIILYIVAFVGLLFVLFRSSGYRKSIPKQERRIPIAVGLAIPFIAVRLAYSALAVFLHDKTFSLIGGSVAVHAAMAIIEEFVVVIDYLILGFSLQKLEVGGEISGRQWKDRNNRDSGRR